MIVAHTPSPNLGKLASALLKGGQAAQSNRVQVILKTPFETKPDDIITSDALLLLTPENLGYMSGALKDFFDRCYYPCLEQTQGLPYAVVIRAGSDGTGTKLAIEKITTGLRWRAIAEPLICKGAWQDGFVEAAFELGQGMSEGIDAGIF